MAGHQISSKFFILGLVLVHVVLVNCEINIDVEEPFFKNTDYYSYLATQCARKGITVEDDLMESVQTCMTTIKEKIGSPKDANKIIGNVCEQLPAVKDCYKNVFNLIETCYDEVFENEVLFTLADMVDNVGKALCTEEKDERITELLNGKMSLVQTASCAVRNYMAMMEDIFDCPTVKLQKQLLLDPSTFKEYSPEEVCTQLGKLEKCVVSTLDLCDKPEIVIKFVKLVYDVIVSIGFKCPSHKNFE